MSRSRPPVEIDMAELRQALDRARSKAIGEADYLKLKTALDILDERLRPLRSTEKTRTIVEQPKLAEKAENPDRPSADKGHGRNGASAYVAARKSVVAAKLACGDACPECARGRVYAQRQPKTLVRVKGQAPLEATVY